MKIIDFISLFYSLVAGGNFTLLSHGEFLLINCGLFLYYRLFGISKDDKNCEKQLYREIKSFTSPRVPLTNLA